MVTVHREAGLRFVIFVDDHPPPHVHVVGDGTMKIEIVGPDGLPLAIATSGMKRGDRRACPERLPWQAVEGPWTWSVTGRSIFSRAGGKFMETNDGRALV